MVCEKKELIKKKKILGTALCLRRKVAIVKPLGSTTDTFKKFDCVEFEMTETFCLPATNLPLIQLYELCWVDQGLGFRQTVRERHVKLHPLRRYREPATSL